MNLTWGFVALLGLLLMYVLSYTPVYRWEYGIDKRPMLPNGRRGGAIIPGDPTLGVAYAPVEWLIDNTLLAEPLFWWGDLWGCGGALRNCRTMRDRLPPDFRTN